MLKKSIMLGILVVLAVAAAAGAGWGVVPTAISFQGKVTPVPSPATISIDFQIYDTPGPTGGNKVGPLIPQSNVSVDPSTGIFNTIIDVSDAALDFTKPYYVSVNFNKAGESTTRQQLTAAPYAITAKNVYGGKVSAESGSFSGSVGIGTTAPAAQLDLAGTMNGGLWARGSSQAKLPAAAGKGVRLYYDTTSGTGAMGSSYTLDYGALQAYDYGSGIPKDLLLNPTGGSVRIGGVGTGNLTLEVVGDICADNTFWARAAGRSPVLPGSAGSGVQIYYDFTSGTNQGVSYQNDFGVVGAYDYYGLGPKNLALNPSGGKVGIGTTNPTSKLTVNGSIEMTSGGRYSIKFPDGTVQTTAANGGQWTTAGNGSDVYKTNTAGRVGIGTTNPTAQLDVEMSDSTGLGALNLSNLNTSGNALAYFNVGNGSLWIGQIGSGGWGGMTNCGLIQAPTGSGGLVFSTGMNWAVETIANTGNVGIGTTKPAAAYKLDVTGAVNSTGGFYENNVKISGGWTTATNGSDVYKTNTAGKVGIGTTNPLAPLQVAQDINGSFSSGQIEAIGATDNKNRMTIGFDTTNKVGWIQPSYTGVSYLPLLLNPAGGKVGIGTSAPTVPLDVRMSDSSGLGILNLFNLNNAGTSVATFNVGGGSLWIGQMGLTSWNGMTNFGLIQTSTGSGGLVFSTGMNGPVETISTNGNVGIGTTSPAYVLDVRSQYDAPQLSLQSSAAETLMQLKNTSTNGRAWWLVTGGSAGSFGGGKFGVFDSNASAARLIIDTGGYVGIGTLTPGNNLEVQSSGNGRGITISSVSDTDKSPALGLASPSHNFMDNTLGLALGQGHFSGDANPGDVVLRSGGKLLLQHGGGTAALTIGTNNVVGIGTANPNSGYALDVAGQCVLGDGLANSHFPYYDDNLKAYVAYVSGRAVHLRSDAALGYQEYMTVDDKGATMNGNVSIAGATSLGNADSPIKVKTFLVPTVNTAQGGLLKNTSGNNCNIGTGRIVYGITATYVDTGTTWFRSVSTNSAGTGIYMYYNQSDGNIYYNSASYATNVYIAVIYSN